MRNHSLVRSSLRLKEILLSHFGLNSFGRKFKPSQLRVPFALDDLKHLAEKNAILMVYFTLSVLLWPR
jgi:hypothetical protein